jgi:flagellar biosynthesis/type III secretory pathway protein FliH
MATVEELRRLLRNFIIGETDRHDVPLVLSQLDVALAAAEAVGFEKGRVEGEKEGTLNERTRQEFGQSHEAREAALTSLATQSQHAYELGKHEGLEQGRAEGAEQERERIRNLARPLNRVYELGEGEGRIILASVLGPKEGGGK